MKRSIAAAGDCSETAAAKAGRSGSWPAIDVERARRETRGCSPNSIFLNAAGSSLPPAVVTDVQVAYLKDEEQHGGYAVAEREADSKLDAFYAGAAKLLGCSKDEIAFAESAQRAWTLLFNSLRFERGDRIVTSASDYSANFVGYLQAKEQWHVEIDVIPDDPTGQVDLALLKQAASHKQAKLISLNHIPTGGGVVQPAAQIGAIAREFNVPYLLDACQSVGQVRVDVNEIGCDMLTVTGRKWLRGPRGTGFLYVRQSFLHRLKPACLDHIGATLVSEASFKAKGNARCFEQYECNFAGKVGLGAALAYLLDIGMPAIEERVKMLGARLRDGLAALEGVNVADGGQEVCGIVTFYIEGRPLDDVKEKLDARSMYISRSNNAGGNMVWYHRRGIKEVIRASPHYFNTEEEMDRFVAAIQQIIRGS